MIYEVLEIKKDGEGTGKYRKVGHNNSFTHAHGLCDHEHDTRDEADACPEAVVYMERIFPPTDECPGCGSQVDKRKLTPLNERLKGLEVDAKAIAEKWIKFYDDREFTREHVVEGLADDIVVTGLTPMPKT